MFLLEYIMIFSNLLVQSDIYPAYTFWSVFARQTPKDVFSHFMADFCHTCLYMQVGYRCLVFSSRLSITSMHACIHPSVHLSTNICNQPSIQVHFWITVVPTVVLHGINFSLTWTQTVWHHFMTLTYISQLNDFVIFFFSSAQAFSSISD